MGQTEKASLTIGRYPEWLRTLICPLLFVRLSCHHHGLITNTTAQFRPPHTLPFNKGHIHPEQEQQQPNGTRAHLSPVSTCAISHRVLGG